MTLAEHQVYMSQVNNGPEIISFIHYALTDALEREVLKLRDQEIIVKIQDALEEGADGMSVTILYDYFHM